MTPSRTLDVQLANARAHEHAGRDREAIEAYQGLLQQWPALPNSWYNLARLQRRSGASDAALASYQQALKHEVEEPEEVHLNRGVIYADDLRQFDSAERELVEALRLNPRYVPALLNLGNLHEDWGQRSEAIAAYDRLLAIAPTNADALSRFALLQRDLAAGDPLIGRLQQAIRGDGASPQDRATLGFALGALLDSAREYDEAFAAYRDANAASRASAASSAFRYDRSGHERLIDRLISTFAKASTRAVAAATAATTQEPPIFICGMFRSGSTLTEQVLAAHSKVVAGGEISFVPELVRNQLKPYPQAVAHLSAQQIETMANAYVAHAAQLAPAGMRVIDKRPENYLHIGLIKTLFPDARIVHTTRSPLDNALSIYFLHLDPSMGYAMDLGDIGHHLREYRRLMAHWRVLYGSDILDFDYDALVADPRPAVEQLLGFCGLGWEASCMDFHKVDNAVRTASVWQVRQPLYTSSSGRWRHYEAHLQPVLEMLKDSTASG